MICSMTAYADQKIQAGYHTLHWEVRSVNSRYLDLVLRLPENLRFLEPGIRNLLERFFRRGKVECNLKLGPSENACFEFRLNRPMVQAVIAALGEISPLLPAAAPVSPLDVARWPGVVQEPEIDREQLARAALEGLESACGKLLESRRREGEKLGEFIRRHCRLLAEQVELARRAMPEALAALRARLRQKVEEISAQPDTDRLEQELVYLAQKLDVTEELDRLQTHLAEIDRLLESTGPIGRRLDFLCQEMNREANTLASKAASSALTQCAIEMKVLIEQIREQVQNIE